MRTRIITGLLTASLALGGVGVAASSTTADVDVAAKTYANCSRLNRV
jgi:hypothetical protein